jgi:hypothetical protein
VMKSDRASSSKDQMMAVEAMPIPAAVKPFGQAGSRLQRR